ncbi:MAG TPA: O-antigen ligase family protein, partial [Chloroflexota bacterium]|nr:O-antigen ligase family protein [Chloroflexota bacterium]
MSIRSLRDQTPALCVLGVLFAIVVSHLAHLNIYEARVDGVEFFKVLIYFLLLVAIIDSPSRLRLFLLWISAFTMLVAIVALLQYHGLIHVASITESVEKLAESDDFTSDPGTLVRLCSTGIFGDPNDLCLMMDMVLIVCVYHMADRRSGRLRFLWLIPMGILGYAIKLTYSRGGLLALVLGIVILFRSRFGWKRTLVCCAVVLPGLLFLFAGRQTKIDFSDPNDTSQGRIQIWSDGLSLFRRSPVFGIGMDHYVDEVGYVAHNSYIH